MSTTPRGAPWARSEATLVLDPPPQLKQRDATAGGLAQAFPIVGSLGSVVMMAGLGGAATGRGHLAAGMFLLATVGFVVVQADRQRQQHTRQVTASRATYLRYLAGIRTLVRETAAQDRRAQVRQHPPPSTLAGLAAERTRVWERRPTDPGFLHVRHGVRRQPLSLALVAPEIDVETVDPVAASALHRLLGVHRRVADMPSTIDLTRTGRIEVCGPEEEARALGRAMICSAATFHAPEHLAIAVLASEHTLVHWDWIKWLPHARSTHRSDTVGAARQVATCHDDLAELTAPPGVSHLLVVVDGGSLTPAHPHLPPHGRPGLTVLELCPPEVDADHTASLRLLAGGPGGSALDQCDLAAAEALARRLAPIDTSRAGVRDTALGARVESADLLQLLGLGEASSLDPRLGWQPQPDRDRLRVPIGRGEDGSVVHLDLKESAQQGMGPHGLVIGATGSGKSEFLRTLVLGLALTHSPEQLAMVLVDFKGGATFAGMAQMPHVSAVITNLAQELTLVDRMHDALSGEMVRRQETLRAAGNYASVRDYDRARAAGAPLDPLPSLFIVVDEFSELLSTKPELIDLFVAIGRLGRSLGLHLLLASQRLDEGRLRGLESHLSYRIGLRTFSAAESRAVLGVPDAYELPPVPGLGFLKPDPSTLLRFAGAYVSGPVESTAALPLREDSLVTAGILPFTVTPVVTHELVASLDCSPSPATVLDGEPAPADSLLDIAVGRMVGHGPVAHQIWLPPLDVPDTLDVLMGPLVEDPALGLVSPDWRRKAGLAMPIGVVDRPRDQRRDTQTIELAGADGHVAVVGGPRSGKSTLLRTVVTSLALTTTPLESQVYVIDCGGGVFAPLAGLPHVAGVANRTDPDVLRRILAELTGILDRRETYFREQGIDTIEAYRARRGKPVGHGRADDGYGDVYLVVDGWSTLRADYDDVELRLQQLAGRGLAYGFHLLVATGRWADIRPAMRDAFGTRLELRLGDPSDSEVDRRLAESVPTGRPGRGLVTGGLHFLTALPRIDGDSSPETLADGIDDLVARVAAAWPGPEAPKLRLLPEKVSLSSLVERLPVDDERLVLGVGEKALATIGVDPRTEPYLQVYGDGQSGKSTTLRTYLREVVRTHTPRQARLVVVDYRRSLLGEVPEGHLLSYLTSASQATPTIQDLATILEARIPGPDVTAAQLRDRSWWEGADVHVVVDDYDLVASQHSSPIAPLQPLMAQARDIGLHLVVARRTGGAGRASYEPVLQSLRELAAHGLMLSGSPDEGVLFGGLRPEPLPPGRGRLWTRDGGAEVVQVAWTDPAA